MQIGDCGLIVRPSIGIVTYPADGNTRAALLKHADTAMYCAKREQTGYAFFSEPAEGRFVTAPYEDHEDAGRADIGADELECVDDAVRVLRKGDTAAE
jgi:GGDEF domain-containing protein